MSPRADLARRPGRPAGAALAGLLLAAAAWGCASTAETRVLPPDDQYARAVELYEDGDYRDAVQAFQAFAFNYPQDPRVIDARWLTAASYAASDDWPGAAQEFLNFQRDFPRDPRAAEALFEAARAYREISLRPELDQRDTQRAVGVLDRLLAEYPRSELVERAREQRARLRDKLAEKEFLNAEFYFDEEDYEAAEIYLTDLIRGYPDTSWLPAAYALLARTRCAQGLTDTAREAAERLEELFPESSAARTVEGHLATACRA